MTPRSIKQPFTASRRWDPGEGSECGPRCYSTPLGDRSAATGLGLHLGVPGQAVGALHPIKGHGAPNEQPPGNVSHGCLWLLWLLTHSLAFRAGVIFPHTAKRSPGLAYKAPEQGTRGPACRPEEAGARSASHPVGFASGLMGHPLWGEEWHSSHTETSEQAQQTEHNFLSECCTHFKWRREAGSPSLMTPPSPQRDAWTWNGRREVLPRA